MWQWIKIVVGKVGNEDGRGGEGTGDYRGKILEPMEEIWNQFYTDDGDERIHGESNREASDGDMEPAALSIEVLEPCDTQWRRLWSQWCSPW